MWESLDWILHFYVYYYKYCLIFFINFLSVIYTVYSISVIGIVFLILMHFCTLFFPTLLKISLGTLFGSPSANHLLPYIFNSIALLSFASRNGFPVINTCSFFHKISSSTFSYLHGDGDFRKRRSATFSCSHLQVKNEDA